MKEGNMTLLINKYKVRKCSRYYSDFYLEFGNIMGIIYNTYIFQGIIKMLKEFIKLLIWILFFGM